LSVENLDVYSTGGNTGSVMVINSTIDIGTTAGNALLYLDGVVNVNVGDPDSFFVINNHFSYYIINQVNSQMYVNLVVSEQPTLIKSTITVSSDTYFVNQTHLQVTEGLFCFLLFSCSFSSFVCCFV
jgi:hypothetical protein